MGTAKPRIHPPTSCPPHGTCTADPHATTVCVTCRNLTISGLHGVEDMLDLRFKRAVLHLCSSCTLVFHNITLAGDRRGNGSPIGGHSSCRKPAATTESAAPETRPQAGQAVHTQLLGDLACWGYDGSCEGSVCPVDPMSREPLGRRLHASCGATR